MEGRRPATKLLQLKINMNMNHVEDTSPVVSFSHEWVDCNLNMSENITILVFLIDKPCGVDQMGFLVCLLNPCNSGALSCSFKKLSIVGSFHLFPFTIKIFFFRFSDLKSHRNRL